MTEADDAQFVDSGDAAKDPNEQYPNVPTPADILAGQAPDPEAEKHISQGVDYGDET